MFLTWSLIIIHDHTRVWILNLITFVLSYTWLLLISVCAPISAMIICSNALILSFESCYISTMIICFSILILSLQLSLHFCWDHIPQCSDLIVQIMLHLCYDHMFQCTILSSYFYWGHMLQYIDLVTHNALVFFMRSYVWVHCSCHQNCTCMCTEIVCFSILILLPELSLYLCYDYMLQCIDLVMLSLYFFYDIVLILSFNALFLPLKLYSHFYYIHILSKPLWSFELCSHDCYMLTHIDPKSCILFPFMLWSHKYWSR